VLSANTIINRISQAEKRSACLRTKGGMRFMMLQSRGRAAAKHDIVS
jgi:hypothetical protein